MKIASAISAPTVKSLNAEPSVAPSGLFKEALESFIRSERANRAKTSKVPAQLKGLIELQQGSYALQLQVECVSRIADSITSSIKKVQQLGGQG